MLTLDAVTNSQHTYSGFFNRTVFSLVKWSKNLAVMKTIFFKTFFCFCFVFFVFLFFFRANKLNAYLALMHWTTPSHGWLASMHDTNCEQLCCLTVNITSLFDCCWCPESAVWVFSIKLSKRKIDVFTCQLCNVQDIRDCHLLVMLQRL